MRGVAFEEQEFERVEHARDAAREFVIRRKLEVDARFLDAPSRAHQALSDRVLAREHRARDRGDRQAAQGVQRERHARFGRKRRMRDREKEAEFLVLRVDVAAALERCRRSIEDIRQRVVHAISSQHIERTPPRRAREPRFGSSGFAFLRPPLPSAEEGFVNRVLRQAEVPRSEAS